MILLSTMVAMRVSFYSPMAGPGLQTMGGHSARPSPTRPLNRRIQFTFSQPAPLPVVKLSRVEREALVAFGNRRILHTPTNSNFPNSPYGTHRRGPFVSLGLEFLQTPGVDIQTLVNDIQP